MSGSLSHHSPARARKEKTIMFIQTETRISFILPEEYELWQKFLETTDMRKWTEHITTQMASYTQKTIMSQEFERKEP